MDPRDEINEAVVRFYAERGRSPAYALIGWETYARLCRALGAADVDAFATSVGEVLVVVDEREQQLVRVLPRPCDFRPTLTDPD